MQNKAAKILNGAQALLTSRGRQDQEIVFLQFIDLNYRSVK